MCGAVYSFLAWVPRVLCHIFHRTKESQKRLWNNDAPNAAQCVVCETVHGGPECVPNDALPWVLLSVQQDDQCIRTAFQSLPPKRLSAPLFSLPSSRALIRYDKISKDREKFPELHSQQQQSALGRIFSTRFRNAPECLQELKEFQAFQCRFLLQLPGRWP